MFTSVAKRAATAMIPKTPQTRHLSNRMHSTVATNLFSTADAEALNKKVDTLTATIAEMQKNSKPTPTADAYTAAKEGFGSIGVVFGAIGVALAASAATAAGISIFSTKIDGITTDVHALDKKIDTVHAALDKKIEANHAELKSDIKDLNHKIDKQDAKIEKIDAKLDLLLTKKSSWF